MRVRSTDPARSWTWSIWRPARRSWKVELDDASAWAASPLFSADGEHVVAGIFWGPYNPDRVPRCERGGTTENPPAGVVGVRVWDADTGDLVEQYDVGRCGGYPTAISATHLLVRTLHGSTEAVAACDWAQGTDRHRDSSIVAAASDGCSPRTPGTPCGVRR